VLERWQSLTLAVYPERAGRFIAGEPDRFRNPVGHLIRENLAILYDGVLSDAPAEEMRRALDPIVRVRAVQDLPPSDAVGFVFLLKQALREGAPGGEPALGVDPEELLRRIDRVALQAFDLYTQCRETIHDLRVREIRARVPRPLRSAAVGSAAPDGSTE
jgi:hypothetical protein